MSKFEKVKVHLKTHKATYIVGGVCLGVGLAGGLGFRSNLNKAKIVRIFSPGDDTIIQIAIPKPGNSGNTIRCLENGTIYPSQNAAAKALGLNPSTISQHLNGRASNTNGLTFEKLAENGVALAA